jgi:hypothetical protein
MIDVIMIYLSQINPSLIIIIITSLAGSYGKDYLRIMKSSKPEKVSVQTVLLSTLTATLVIYGLSDLVIEKFGEKILPFLSFACGLGGFPLMEDLSTMTVDRALDLFNKSRGVSSHKKEEITINIDNHTDYKRRK